MRDIEREIELDLQELGRRKREHGQFLLREAFREEEKREKREMDRNTLVALVLVSGVMLLFTVFEVW